MSREAFAKVFKVLTTKNFNKYYSLFDIYENKLKGQMGFDTFYVAYLVFDQLNLISTENDTLFYVYQNKNEKKLLTESKLYNKLMLLKNTVGAV